MSNEYETWKAYAENLQAQRENDAATIDELFEGIDRQTSRLIERETELREVKAQLAEAVGLLLTVHAGNVLRIEDDVRINDFLARHAQAEQQDAQAAQAVDAQKEISNLIGFEFKPDELQTVTAEELLRVFWRGAALATQPAVHGDEAVLLLRKLDEQWNAHDGEKQFGKLMLSVESFLAMRAQEEK